MVFKDVTQYAWYSDAVVFVAARGITTGTGNNLYKPTNEITRQEMFTLSYNTLKMIDQLPEGKAGKALTDFSDSNIIAPWAKDGMTLFVKTEILSGSNGKLSLEDTGSRAQMAQVIYNLLAR